MADSPRLEELRRRVQADPASIAFAALAEEYRRAGKFREAVEASRAGLRYHPTYVSARVTLGRSLVELQETEQAERELAFVLKSAPDNLAARRALGELCWQQLRFSDALDHFRTAHALAPADTELPTILQSLERELAADRNGANGQAEEHKPDAAPAPVDAPAVAEAAPANAVAEAATADVDADTVIMAAPSFVAATPHVDATPHVEARPQAEVIAPVDAAAPIEAAAAVDATPHIEAAARVEAVAPIEAAAPNEATTPVEAITPVDAIEIVEATPLVAAAAEVAAFDAVDTIEHVEHVDHVDHIEHVDRFEHVAQGERVEYVAEFEPIDAVAFVDDHVPAVVGADEVADVAAMPVVIEELPSVVEVVDEPPPVPVAATPMMNGHAAVSPTPSASPTPAAAPTAKPNPALVRLERFHRAILAARKRSHSQPHT